MATKIKLGSAINRLFRLTHVKSREHAEFVEIDPTHITLEELGYSETYTLCVCVTCNGELPAYSVGTTYKIELRGREYVTWKKGDL